MITHRKYTCTACGTRTNGALIRPECLLFEQLLNWFKSIPSEYLGCPECGRQELAPCLTQRATLAEFARLYGQLPALPKLKFTILEEED